MYTYMYNLDIITEYRKEYMMKHTLENTEFRPIYMFVKFQSKSRLEEMRNKGHIYMKRLKYYIDLERDTGIRGIGDKYEARLFSATSLRIYREGEDIPIKIDGPVNISDKSQYNKPIFCLTAINIVGNIISYNHPKFESLIEFDEKLLDDFDHADDLHALVITNVEKFIERVRKTTDKKNFKIRYDLVNYLDTSYIRKSENKYAMNTVFTKNEHFAHQQEFRIMVETEVDDKLELFIRDISDISTIMPAKQLINGLKIKGDAGTPEGKGQ